MVMVNVRMNEWLNCGGVGIKNRNYYHSYRVELETSFFFFFFSFSFTLLFLLSYRRFSFPHFLTVYILLSSLPHQ